MKRSSITLITVGLAAMVWSFAFQWMSVQAIKDYSAGKPSRFSIYNPNSHFRPAITTLILPVFHELEIRGDGKVEVTIEKGSTFSIRMDTVLCRRVKQHMEYDRLVLELEGYSAQHAGVYTISAPSLKNVVLNSTSTTLIREFTEDALTVTAHDVYPLSIKQCHLGAFTLACLDSLMTQYIDIRRTNEIGHLYLNIKGAGTLRLETAGKIGNDLRISDLIEIQASGRILKQLTLR